MIKDPKKIVISRTDSIGDVVLTLPLAGILKTAFPNTKIIFLGNTYTKPIIQCSSHIDVVWEWAELEKKDERHLVDWLKSQEIDVFLHIFPRKKLAQLVKKAGIKHRVGTSHRLYHLLTCNHRPNFTRKKSDLHEAQLNTKLLIPLGIQKEYSLDQLWEFAGFHKIPSLPEKFKNLIDPTKINLVLHAKSQGSAIEWGVTKFIELASTLDAHKFNIFFTGTEKESESFRSQLPSKENIHDLSGQMTLDELIAFIANIDGLVAASTGPLHIAGLTNRYAIGLFSSIRPIHPGRWRPLGENVIILVDEKNTDFSQPLAIDIRDVVEALNCLEKK